MDFRKQFLTGAVVFGLAAGLCGCAPPGSGQSDDENEPHFVLGKSRVNAMDYQGAVEAFDESLDADPHSAAAHFELGWLYDEKESDPAAAIYHYQQYLKFNPNAENADVIHQRILLCKQELAADVLPLPSAPAMQQQLEKLTGQNRQLQDEVDKWRAYYQSQQTAATNPPAIVVAQQIPNPVPIQPAVANANPPANPPATTVKPRTHSVVAGETPISIARKYGIGLNALIKANPGLNPRHMRVGQVLKLP
jgi:tetratricopeptide (TPR) repeat protein